MIRLTLSVVVYLLFSFTAYAQSADTSGAFGMFFGESKSKIQERGVSLVKDEKSSDDNMQWYDVAKLPSQPSDTDYIRVAFTNKALQKITWVSKDIYGDSYGTAGKEKFSYYENILNRKYGVTKPELQYQAIGRKVYKEVDEFYQCLNYDGCGMWASVWSGPWGSTVLEIQTTGKRGLGWLKISYEGPAWGEAVDAVRKAQEKKDQGSF